MSDTILQSNDVMDSRRGDIVVGVDGSDESFAALRWALGEASLTGQQVNAVYAWTHSWDMGSQPEDEEQWAQMRHDIARRLREWVAQASQGMTIDENRVKLTSVKATGTAALLEIGKERRYDFRQVALEIGIPLPRVHRADQRALDEDGQPATNPAPKEGTWPRST